MVSAMTRRHQELRRLRESRQKERGGVERLREEIADIFSDPSVALTDFRIRPLFEALVDDGYELVQYHFNESGQGGGFRMQEAGNVDTSLFAYTQGQYLYNAVLRAYQMPELIGDRLVTVQNTIESGEKIPGVSDLGDEVEVVKEGDPYPTASVAESWVQTPETIKRGLIVNITKEVVFFDKTNLILQRAAGIGRTIAINREKRILDVVLGLATVYSRNGAPVEATYQSDNTVTTNPLVDWTSVDAADVKFSAITDPDTGEPIATTANMMVVPPALRNTANRILNATMTGQTTSSRETQVSSASLNGTYEVLSNQYVKQRTSSDTSWFYGDMPGAFVYMENWPLKVVQEGANSEKAFDADIVARYKASERGAAGVLERRYALKSTS